ncbi:MAG: hypothetical protein NVSMB52_03680 [Chloroflexota bacterium]
MSIDRRRTGGYVPLREAMNQLFEGSFITPQVLNSNGQGGFPSVDMYMTEEDILLRIAVPGASPENIDISVTGDTVTVSGEIRKEQFRQKGQPYYEEIWSGKFQRSFQLPIQADPNKADAVFEHGILSLTLPKSETTKPRKIQVRGQSTISGQNGGGSASTGAKNNTVESETVAVHSQS